MGSNTYKSFYYCKFQSRKNELELHNKAQKYKNNKNEFLAYGYQLEK